MYILRNQLNHAEIYFLDWEESESHSRTSKAGFYEKTKLTLLLILGVLKG